MRMLRSARRLVARAIPTSPLGIVVVVLLALTLWSATRTATVIDPIEIPEELKRDGYTPAIISHMIIDQMDKILKKADIENSGPASYKASGASRVSVTGTNGATSTDIAIPGAGMSIGSTIAYAKQVLGFPDRHISGEIIGENKKYKLTLRSLGSPLSFNDDLSGASSDLEGIIRLGAVKIIVAESP